MTMLSNDEHAKRNAQIVSRGGLDNEMLYHEFTDSMRMEQEIARERWELQKDLIRKATNLPHAPRNTGEMSIDNRNISGFGWKEMAVLGGGLLGAGGLGYLAMKPGPPPQPPAAVAPANPGPAEDRDTDTTGEYDIEWDKPK